MKTLLSIPYSTLLALTTLSMISRAQDVDVTAVRGWLASQALIDPDHDWSEDGFYRSVSRKTHYTKDDLESYHPLPKTKPTGSGGGENPGHGRKSTMAPLALRIRANFDDVLATEDPSLNGKDKPNELSGASLSFSRDMKSNDNTWQGKGSLILPLIFLANDVPDENWQLISYGFTPSISYEGLDTQGDPASEKDSLVYRMGGFINFGGPVSNGFLDMTPYDQRMENRLRAFLSYGTDYHHRLSIPAAEVEYEPRYDTGGKLALGYWRTLWFRPGYRVGSSKFNQSEDTLLSYQLRTLLKFVGGSVEDNDDNPSLEDGGFSRIGPIIELKLDPFFAQRLSLTTRYQYFFTLEGSDNAPSRFDTSLEWAFWQDEDTNQKFSLKATYVNGPMDFRQKDEESFLIGLGLTY